MQKRLTSIVTHLKQACHRHAKLLIRASVGTGVLFILVVIAQLLYPQGRLLPFVRIDDRNMGGKTLLEATRQLEAAYSSARIEVVTDGKVHTESLVKVGFDVASTATASEAVHYSFGRRLIPFSSVAMMIKRDVPLRIRVDDVRVRYFAEQVAKESSTPAINAGVSVQNDKVELIPSRPSREYPPDRIVSAIYGASLSPRIRVNVKPVAHAADRTNTEVATAVDMARKVVATPLVFRVAGESFSIDRPVVASWLEFSEDPNTKQLTMQIRADKVREHLTSMQPKTYVAPGVSRVVILDGREVSRSAGASGRGVNLDAAVQQVKSTLEKAESATLSLPTVTLSPAVSYDRQYTDTSAGLGALLSYIVASKGSYSISVIELGHHGRVANVGGNRQFLSASTYKLFVAYAVIKQIESGQMQWGDIISGDQSAEGCFEAMIVRSDNPCAKAFGDRIGWGNIEGMMRGIGLGGTTYSNGFYTTANDLALFLQKLQTGTLLSSSGRERLLNAMGRQIYRSGIPTGTRSAVANKVGGLGSLVHDAGIVYTPRGHYVVAIMSSGSSWPGVADVARQVHAYLNR